MKHPKYLNSSELILVSFNQRPKFLIGDKGLVLLDKKATKDKLYYIFINDITNEKIIRYSICDLNLKEQGTVDMQTVHHHFKIIDNKYTKIVLKI